MDAQSLDGTRVGQKRRHSDAPSGSTNDVSVAESILATVADLCLTEYECFTEKAKAGD